MPHPTSASQSYLIQLDDAAARQVLSNDAVGGKVAPKVQLLRTGTFSHPKHGELIITTEILNHMIQNFKDGVRGIDPSVHYKHDPEGKAAGWPRQLELSEDGTQLWAHMEWTRNGEISLAEKEYRYLSSEFDLNYTDAETGQNYGPTLFGAALTNRPFIKRMDPAVELTELSETPDRVQTSNLEENVKTKLSVKLKELKIDEKTKGDLVQMAEAAEQSYAEMEGEQRKLQELEMTPEQMMAKIKELEAKIMEMKKREEEMLGEKQLSEKKEKFQALVREGKAVPAQEKAYLEDDMVKFTELAQATNDNPGGSTTSTPKSESGSGKLASDEIHELAEKKMKEDGTIDLSEAYSSVRKEKPELWAKYEKEADGEAVTV